MLYPLIGLLAASAVYADLYKPLKDHAKHARMSKRNNQETLDSGHHRQQWKRAMGPTWASQPALRVSDVQTGVAGMQMTVTGNSHILIIDKAEQNPAQVHDTHGDGAGSDHSAWVQWLDYETGASKTLDATTNSFCAGGTWLSNGSMVSVGGNPRENAASYYAGNGLTALRVFKQCDDDDCEIFEDTNNVRMASARWYPGTCRLQDGSMMILGGMTEGGFNNVKRTDNPSIEYFPSKSFNGGLPLYSAFLADALNSNLFPVTWLLPGGKVFVAANTKSMIYDWTNNVEQRMPDFPNGQRITYPFSAASTLLPLTKANNWTPEGLFCGGSTIEDTLQAWQMSSQTPACKQCSRMVLTPEGAQGGWQVEQLEASRVMGEAILTPDGQVVIVNGAYEGLAGYGNVPDQVGQSNADHPAYQSVAYNPNEPVGQRLNHNMPTSNIPRMYHSVASLTPSGDIIITGSNPNADVSRATYATEYRIELLSPPYMNMARPEITGFPSHVYYGQTFRLNVNTPQAFDDQTWTVVLMDLGYHTHAVSVDQRLVELPIEKWRPLTQELEIHGPLEGSHFAPGWGWLFFLVDNVPSRGQRIMIGDGADPPFDAQANHNMLERTKDLNGAVIY